MIVRRTASYRLTCPSTTFVQCGVLASSRSASQTLAPELSALIAILRSVGPVISTRRSTSPGAGGGTCHDDSRISRVSGRKSSLPVRAISSRRCGPPGQQLVAARPEPALQVVHEGPGLGAEDLVHAR